jgi:hypothetical protein
MTAEEAELRDFGLIYASTMEPEEFKELRSPDTEIFTKYQVGWFKGVVDGATQSIGNLQSVVDTKARKRKHASGVQ